MSVLNMWKLFVWYLLGYKHISAILVWENDSIILLHIDQKMSCKWLRLLKSKSLKPLL